jgi:hypothetical protein
MWLDLRGEVEELFSGLEVFDVAGGHAYLVVAGSRGQGRKKSGKGGARPEGYEKRPARAMYKHAWRLANREAINARRRALRVAERARNLESVDGARDVGEELHAA